MHRRSSACTWRLAAARLGVIAMAATLCLIAAPTSAADTPAKPSGDTTIKITPFPPSVQVDAGGVSDEDRATDGNDKRAKHGHARIHIGRDRESDPFDAIDVNEALRTAPWAIGLVFLIVGSIFLTPVILLIGIIWYKLRKTRLQNEAWLKLAEKGVMPPTQAFETVTSGVAPGTHGVAAAGAASAGPAYQQALAKRRGVVWSDLRKGVLLAAFGLALVMYSMTEGGRPNWLGLVLLFVGVGYVALWWLEDRHLARRDAGDGATK